MVDSEAFRFRSVTCRIVEDSSVQFLGHAKCSDLRLNLISSRSAEKTEKHQSVEDLVMVYFKVEVKESEERSQESTVMLHLLS